MTQPSPQLAQHVAQLLANAISGAGSHKASLDQIEALATSNTEYFGCCAALLCDAAQDPIVRHVAGTEIKKNLHNSLCTSNPVVQQCTMQSLTDPSEVVRRAASSIIAKAISKGVWGPEVIHMLCQGLQSDQVDTVSGCMLTIKHLIDESVFLFNTSQAAVIVVNAVLPLLSHTNLKVRNDAFIAVVYLLDYAGDTPGSEIGNAFKSNVQTLLTHCGAILTSTDPNTANLLPNAIRCLHQSFMFHEQISPLFDAVTEQISMKALDRSEAVRTEVVEFWSAVLRVPEFTQRTQHQMPNVVQYLMDCMKYSEMEFRMLKASENDWNIQDKPEDIKPKNYQRRRATDVEDDDDDDEVAEWTLRKCACQCLDDMARALGGSILETVMSIASQRMQQGDWLSQESGVLALASVFDGCRVDMEQHLPFLVEALLQMIGSDQTYFLVKCSCLWALSCFAEYLVENDDALQKQFYVRSVQAATASLQSSSKKVQEFAINSLTQLISEGPSMLQQLEPLVVPIISQLEWCFTHFQMKNKYLMFGCVDTICACFGRRLADDDVMTKLMKPLIDLWSTIPDHDVLIFPYFMSLAGACTAIGQAIQSWPMTETMFTRSLALAQTHLNFRLQAKQAGKPAPDDTAEFLIAALDLLAGLAAALESGLAPFVRQVGEENFKGFLKAAAEDVDAHVRASAFGVLGELARCCVSFVQVYLTEFAYSMFESLQKIKYVNAAVAGATRLELELEPGQKQEIANIAFALGWLAVNQIEGSGLQMLEQTMTDALMTPLGGVLAAAYDPDLRNMFNNVALCLGRIVYVDPAALARQPNLALQTLLIPWCNIMRNVENSIPFKEQAVRGMVGQLKAQPGLAASAAALDVFTSFPSGMPADFVQEVASVLQQTKVANPQGWAATMQGYSPGLKQKLYLHFGVQ